MIKITNKMPITIALIFFSYFIAVCGIATTGLWTAFKYKDSGSLILAFLILAGSLLLAALIRMFANIGQMIFDIRVDMYKAFMQGETRNDALIQNLQSMIQKLGAIKDNFDQMNCDSRDMNQNIHQIRDFFEQIERHLDLKK